MQILNLILSSYADFFNPHMWVGIFTSPVAWGLIGTLVIMEGLLSTDNALVLALKVSHLPKKQQKKALLFGIWGAYLFRFIAIGLGTALIKLEFIKVIGGAYLLWMALKFFKDKFLSGGSEADGDEDEESSNKDRLHGLARYIGTFWATVAIVEMLDITFSVDSVLAAFGVSGTVGILLLGGMLGILMMRGVAGVFTLIMAKVPELEVTAYVLIAFIGFKMIASVFGIEISTIIFLAFLVGSFAVTILVHFMRQPKQAEV